MNFRRARRFRNKMRCNVQEVWKSIPGYEGYYEASSLGHIRSVARLDRLNRFCPSVDLKPQENTGYQIVKLRRNSVLRDVKVHTLVLETFVCARPEGMEACHGNGVRTDNRLENLRWDTRVANARDKVMHGTQPYGSRQHSSKLTESLIPEIRRSKLPSRMLAEKFGVSMTAISQARRRETWKHVA